MKKKPFFTIVIANYNHGKFLDEAIDSVNNQSYKNFELFVIDAKSNDNSVDVIKNNESKIDWWVSESDSGQSEAFNKGFKKANGQFLFWLNADDIILPKTLEVASEIILKDKNIDWIAANTIFFNEKGNITKCTNGGKWSNFLFSKAPLTVYGPTSIFSKKIFDELGGFDEDLDYGMDTDLWYRFKRKGYSFRRINKYFWGFRIHNDSKTSHAYSGKRSSKFESESMKIRKKNNIKFDKKIIFLQKLVKIFNGNYIKSFIDTKKFAGIHISKFKS